MKMRLLFVDDEPCVLAGLQTSLRSQSQQWEMFFSTSAEEALAILEKERMDVLITDLHMPKMDGDMLLRVVREKYPCLTRIVLSDQSKQEASIHAAQVAHQILRKPCAAEAISNVVNRVHKVRMVLREDRFLHKVTRIGALPSVPRTYSELLRMLENPDSSLEAIARVIEQDVAMTAKIMQLVNSSFFGLGYPILSIEKGVSLLGTYLICQLALAAEVFSQLCPNESTAEFSLALFHQHCRLTAKIAQRILTVPQRREEVFLAALLHDVGKLIFLKIASDRYEEVLRKARAKGQTLSGVEKEMFGVTHSEIGACLLALWGLPSLVVEAVLYHHEPDQVPSRFFDVPNAVYAANLLAKEQQLGAFLFQEADVRRLEAVGERDPLPRWRGEAEKLADCSDPIK